MRIIKRALVAIVLCATLLLTLLYFMQEKFIFLPTQLAQDYTYSFEQNFQEVFIEAPDGARLNAIHFTTENPKGVILYFHGNAGDLSRWGIIAGQFAKLQYDVLVMDYRTYGKSTGVLSEAALLSDAQMCYDYLLKRYSEDQISVYGRSLGTSFATFVASKNSPKRLLLESPFFNIAHIAKKRFPILPVSYFLKYHLASNTYMLNVRCPVTIFHGTEDAVVPYDSGEKLARLVSKELLTFVTIIDGGHNDLIEFETYRNALVNALY